MNKNKNDYYILTTEGMEKLVDLVSYLQKGRPLLINKNESIKLEVAKIITEGVFPNIHYKNSINF